MKGTAYIQDIFNWILHCLIGCRKVIDAINYYEISDVHKELDENFKVILSDILYAVIGEGIIAANDLVLDTKSPINYIKIQNKIDEEKLDKKDKARIIQQIISWHNTIRPQHQSLMDKKNGIGFLRDKVFAHTDIEGMFSIIDKGVLENLKTVILHLYELYHQLLNEMSGKDNSKSTIAKTQPMANEYLNQSKDKARLLKKLFLLLWQSHSI